MSETLASLPQDLSRTINVHTNDDDPYPIYSHKHIDIANDLHLIGGLGVENREPGIWDAQLKLRNTLKKEPNYEPHRQDPAILSAAILKLLEWSDQFTGFSPKFPKPMNLRGIDYGGIYNLMKGTLDDGSGEIVSLLSTFEGTNPGETPKYIYNINLEKLRASETVINRLNSTVAESQNYLTGYFHNRRIGF